MVARDLRLPNIRKFFVPDTGFTICDADLMGADAQVVAWEADDEDLKTAFRAGLKIHVHNARALWPEKTKDMTDADIKATSNVGGLYYDNKRSVHLTNYGGSPDAIVSVLNWSYSQASEFQERWFFLHPKIKEWHKRFERYLQGTQCWNCDHFYEKLQPRCPECGVSRGRTVKNAFGFRRIYFDRVDGLLPEALAWTPQSSVSIALELGWVNIAKGHEWISQFVLGERTVNNWKEWLLCPDAKEKWGHLFEFLIQVHDSVVFQVPTEYEEQIPDMIQDMRVTIPYKDPLIIPMSYGHSRVSWGDCKE